MMVLFVTYKNEIRKWYKNFKFFRPVMITGVLSDKIGFSDSEFGVYEILANNRNFINRVHKNVFKKSKQKISRLVVIERGLSRYHSHIVLETPQHLSRSMYESVLHKCWKDTPHGVSSDVTQVYDFDGVSGYLSKEIYQNSKSQVDFENCHLTIS